MADEAAAISHISSIEAASVAPEDSVSNAGSRHSRGSSRASVAAERQALIVKQKYAKLQGELEIRQKQLEVEMQQLQLEALIEAAAAQEAALDDGQDVPTVEQPAMNGISATVNPVQSNLNPMASEWLAQTVPLPAAKVVEVPAERGSEFRELLATLRLPQTQLPKFEGDPLKYWTFIRAFDHSVGDMPVDAAAKLNRLLQYCVGKALKVIEGCAVMEPGIGYAKARQLLKERFGNDYTISDAWVRRIVEGPVVKAFDKVGLRELADDARLCMETLAAMNMLSEIGTRDKMVKIVNRLPLHMQGKWRHMAVKKMDSSGRYPDFAKLVEFLEVAAREMNDPVFGCSDDVARDSKGKYANKAVKQGASFGTEAASEKAKGGSSANGSTGSRMECYACSGNHQLSQCNEFKKMTPEKRLEIVKERKLCYNCLSSKNHVSRKCYKNAACMPGCNLKHAKLLHEALTRRPQNEDNHESTGSTQTVDAQSCACIPAGAEVVKVALPVVSVVVSAKEAKSKAGIRTYALLDPGSNKSFCSMDLVHRLGLKGTETSLALATLNKDGNTSAVEVAVEVSGTSARKRIVMPRVYALEAFPALTDSIVSADDVKEWKHLRGIKLPNAGKKEVSLLIGQDVPQALVPVELRRGQDGEPFAVRTPLGWTINGPLNTGKSGDSAVCNLIDAVPSSQGSLETQVEQFWRLDTGQLSLSQVHLSVDDKQVLESWNKSVAVKDGHYELGIPFKTDPPELPDNRVMAERRLQSLKRRLLMNPDLLKQYTKEMEAVIARGHAEHIETEEAGGALGRRWYLPHHCVTNPNKPDKLRVVYDCAAKFQGTSLNDKVLQGPDLTNKLIGVILRFREGQVAIMGDIEAMFHQVKVSVEHRDALRFLWWPGGDLSRAPEMYRKTVHPFGGVWSPSCANFALRRTAEDYGTEFDCDTVQTVLDNFYADDCLKSVNSEDKAVCLVQQLCQLLSQGGFHLTKWISNNRVVLNSIPGGERAKELCNLNLDRESLPVERALGVVWNTEHDQFGITVKVKEKEFTKRGLLSVLSSVYDPLGMVSPFVLNAKKIFQNECRITKAWDETINAVSCKQWKKWLEELPLLEEFQLKRCIVQPEFGKVVKCELHHFSDASQDAYGAVSYVRLINDRAQIHCAFMLARSKLAPMKAMTIPRLELMAAVVAVQLKCILSQETRIEVHRSVFWTDSMIVLQYIKNCSRRFHTFVANRVAMLHDTSSPEQWRYVNSELNPADDVSRGLNATDLVQNARWKRGPDFLWMEEADWPRHPATVPDLLVEDREVRNVAKCCTVDSSLQNDSIDLLFTRHSDWFRLTKSVAWLRKFISWIAARRLKKMNQINNSSLGYPRDVSGILSVGKLRDAELVIIRWLQNKNFDSELRCLKSPGGIIPKSSSIYRLEPYMDDSGILRVCGRLQSASIRDEAKHPAILPNDSHVTKIIVQHVHEVEACHSGREYVLACLRRKYWIPGARTVINKVLRDCIMCKRRRALPANQRMADLPLNRVVPGKAAFVNVGVDCFGPFQVKSGRSYEKRYGCLFTCLAMRAVHIERLQSLESGALINALVRFISRRGVPDSIRSDNGTNFVGCNRELRSSVQAWNQNSELKKFLLLKQIDWKFNTPAASHHGGVWERQIGSVRKVLNIILKDQTLDDERLDTVFCEVEAIVNGRPLTAVPDSPNDFEALTPNHLLLLRSCGSGPLGECLQKDAYVRRWKHVQYLADMFWNRWIREYLPTLQLRQKWLDKRRNIRVGDLVLVLNENTPRKLWPLARVTRTFPGKDGLVRSAEVKTSWSILTRPVNKLCLLEGADCDCD